MITDFDGFRTPGQLIQALLEATGWSKRVLAVVLEMDETGIGRLVTDKRSVDAKLALALEDLFGVPAERFLDLQKSFDLAKARLTEMPDPKRATRAKLFGDLPASEMIKRGWLRAKDVRDPVVHSELMRFFGVNRLEDIETLPHAAKKTEVNTTATPAQMAWLYRVRQIAQEMLVAKYSSQALVAALSKLSQLLLAPEEARKVPRILAECGVRFLVVETLPGAKIDGVCFWLNDRSPVVALSMRYDRIDNFWFVLRHELEHVLCEHGKGRFMLDTDIESELSNISSNIAEEEKFANEAAANFCVPKQKMDAFIARKSPFFFDRDILAFAKMISVHPGLIAGQIRRRTNKYDRFSEYLVKVRASVLPSAVTDGWGNVYPVEG